MEGVNGIRTVRIGTGDTNREGIRDRFGEISDVYDDGKRIQIGRNGGRIETQRTAINHVIGFCPDIQPQCRVAVEGHFIADNLDVLHAWRLNVLDGVFHQLSDRSAIVVAARILEQGRRIGIQVFRNTLADTCNERDGGFAGFEDEFFGNAFW